MKKPLSHDDIREVSINALVAVVDDKLSPAAARAGAARTLLEAIGAIGRLQDAGKLNENRSASEMSSAEIADEIARLSQRLPPAKMRKVKL
jgi:hypothetical protein